MRVESWVGVMAMFLVVFGGAIAAEQQCRRSFLPANVFLLHDIEEPLQRIYERAPSFRAQCARIAAAKGLRVTVRIDPTYAEPLPRVYPRAALRRADFRGCAPAAELGSRRDACA